MTTQTERSQKLEQELATVQSELADLRGDVTDLQAGRPAPSNGERAITLSAPDAAAHGEPTTVRSLHRVIDPGRFREELAAALRDQNGGIALRNLTVKPDRSAAAITWQVPMDQHGQLPGWLRAH